MLLITLGFEALTAPAVEPWSAEPFVFLRALEKARRHTEIVIGRAPAGLSHRPVVLQDDTATRDSINPALDHGLLSTLEILSLPVD
jgi:hypothetical protein